MKGFTCLVAMGVLIAEATGINAQPATDRGRLVPANNIAAARSRYPLGDFGRIATNTPAFEEYGLNFMLAKANEMREAWQLDIPKPPTVNDVLFQLRATVHGLDGALSTRDKRYLWSFDRNAVTLFRDYRHCQFPGYSMDLEADLKRARELAKIKSRITPQEAEAVAREALHKLGLTEKQLHLKEPPLVNQEKIEEPDGTIYALPRFTVKWREEGDPEPEEGEFDSRPVTFEISGITGNVSEYFNASRNAPRAPLPTNYFPMLGLPDDYLETLPERKRLLWGLPPLANPPSPRRNSSP